MKEDDELVAADAREGLGIREVRLDAREHNWRSTSSPAGWP